MIFGRHTGGIGYKLGRCKLIAPLKNHLTYLLTYSNSRVALIGVTA